MNAYKIVLLDKNSKSEVSKFLDLLQISFKKSVDYYNWKHNLNNSYKIEEYTFCVFQDNLCIATIQIIVNSLKALDRTIRFGLLCDGATHKDYRRYGLFEQMLKHCVEFSKEINVDFVYSTGNNKSRQALFKLGYQDFFTTEKAQKKLRYNQAILKPFNNVKEIIAKLNFNNDSFIEEISIEQYQSFISSNQDLYSIYFNKSLEYLEWRLNKPECEYMLFGNFDTDKKLTAVIVIQIKDDMMYVKDYMCHSNEKESLNGLLKHVLKLSWHNKNISRINAIHNSFNDSKEVFRSNGFKITRHQINTLIKPVKQDFKFNDAELENMHFMRIDKNE